MAKIKASVKDFEDVAKNDGLPEIDAELHSVDEALFKVSVDTTGYSEEKKNNEIADDSVSLYISECSRTALLTAKEERTLSSRMELARYLAGVEKQISDKAKKGIREVEIVVWLLSRLAGYGNLLDKILKKFPKRDVIICGPD